MSISVSVPGSMMLLGEHAVLHHQPAIVAAVNRRIKVTIRLRCDRKVDIVSGLGEYSTSLDNLVSKPPFDYVIAAIKQVQHRLCAGFTLLIHSEFEGALGLGSSTAVVVATAAALLKTLGVDDPRMIYQYALAAVLSSQTYGSGADVAASIYGGMIHYQKQPFLANPLPFQQPLCLVYSGKKVKTKVVIEAVAQRFSNDRQQLLALYDAIGDSCRLAIQALANADLDLFFQAVWNNQEVMQALGVCDQPLADIIAYCRRQKQVHAAKISGSGLGDCIVVFGALPRNTCPYPIIDVGIDPLGVQYL